MGLPPLCHRSLTLLTLGRDHFLSTYHRSKQHLAVAFLGFDFHRWNHRWSRPVPLRFGFKEELASAGLCQLFNSIESAGEFLRCALKTLRSSLLVKSSVFKDIGVVTIQPTILRSLCVTREGLSRILLVQC